MPTATARTGIRNPLSLASRTLSATMMATAMTAPIQIMVQGRLRLKTPSATELMRVACGAWSASPGSIPGRGKMAPRP
jgi:hypothetical protein